MHRVIETVVYDEAMFESEPLLRDEYLPGILVVLDPEELSEDDVEGMKEAERIRISKPDGTSSEADVLAAYAKHGQVSLLLDLDDPADIPEGSSISW
jgi:hypothetical protein